MKENDQEKAGAASSDGSRIGMERIDSFSDAVFAVAITLLILTIGVPDVASQFADQQLPSALADLYPKFFGYVLSFVIIGHFWMHHHDLFRFIRRHDGGLIWLNHFFLMCIVFLPFPTELMSTYENSRWAVGFYAVSLAVCSLMMCALWWYATSRRDLVEGTMEKGHVQDSIYSFLAASLVFLLSLALLPVSTSVTKLFWITIWPVNTLIGRKFNPRRKRVKVDGN
jgi:uncharacterized membrane protein